MPNNPQTEQRNDGTYVRISDLREALLSKEALAAATKRTHPLIAQYKQAPAEQAVHDCYLAIEAALTAIGLGEGE